ncbi:MAG TPA: hypothetical protein DDZ66_14685 [Firmicutes bacterium]|jgi:pheromone shutdown-related protein TraB|nr:hypothetical protein [Bacillota bacterium]
MMNENITRLQYGEKEIILVASAHVSKESANLVKMVVEEEQPDSVCVELDHDRYNNIQNPKVWDNQDIVKAIKSKRVGFLLTNLALSSYQKKIAKKLDVPLGGDMMQGIESAKAMGATLVLADRNIHITFSRIWSKLSRIEKVKLIFGLLFSLVKGTNISDKDLQELLQGDMLESILADMHKKYPKIGDVLITERDQYLAAKIRTAPGKKIVAVLGGAHVPGVKKEIVREGGKSA